MPWALTERTPYWFFAFLPSGFKLLELMALTKHLNLILLFQNTPI